ncbi:unnamed protein product [Penicillium pancosmium]
MASVFFRGNNHGLQIGDNRGLINADFHLPPERPETPPNPLSTVPFPRDPEFVSRETLLDRIHEKSSVPGSRIALVGLGGVGKSQLAIEYSYRIRSDSPATWVFWVHASNESRFEESFRDIADQLKIPGRQNPEFSIFKLVENWLRDERKGDWVCILDNVDEANLLYSFSTIRARDPPKSSSHALTKPLVEYIPRTRKGRTIITGRSRDVALKMVNDRDLVEVQPMEESEALELLQRALRQSEESPHSRQLVSALQFLPLAIVQAGSYIRKLGPRSSVSRYLDKFQGSDIRAIELLEKEAGHRNRDWEAKNSILVTLQISFDHIHRTKPSAAELLSIMSFFDRQGIPENLVRHQPKSKCASISDPDCSDTETSDSDLDIEFEDDIIALRDYSLISISEEGTMLTMHRMVQLATHAWLEYHGQLNQWRERFINIINEAFPPTGEFENWEQCRLLFPHVKSALLQPPNSPECLRTWATLLYRGAWYGLQSGTVANVRDMASNSMKQRVKLLGAEDKEAIASTVMLARAYRAEGQWEKAERLFLWATKKSKTTLGGDNPCTLTSMAGLASTYLMQGRWQEAEKLFMQVIQASKARLGEHHSDTLSCISNLALTHLNQGRWGEAEKLFLKVMKTGKTSFDEDHPFMLVNKGNLALTFTNQGRWGEAEKLFLQVIQTRNIKLGQDHESLLGSMANLAVTYQMRGQWDEAEKLFLQVIKTLKMKLGEDHPDTLSTMSNLALNYISQGRWGEAEKLNVQVIETRKTKLGEDHPNTLLSRANLVSTYMNQGRWKDAERLNAQVVQTRRTDLSEDHPDTLASMANLAAIHRNRGRCEEAERLNLKVMEARRIKLGESHHDTLTSMANLASTYMSQCRWGEAENLLVQVIKTRKTTLGENHSSTLLSMTSLALAWKSSGHRSRAFNLLRVCLAKQIQTIGPNHPHTLATSETLVKWLNEGPSND